MNSLKVSTRLAFGFGSLLVFLAAVAFVGLLELAKVNSSLESAVTDRAPNLEILNDLAYRSMDNARIIRNLILLKDEKKKATNKDLLDKNNYSNDEHISHLQNSISGPDAKAFLDDIVLRRGDYQSYSDDVIKLGLINDTDAAISVLYGEKYKTQAAYLTAIRKMVDYQKAAMNTAASEAAQSYKFARETILALSLLAALVGIGIAVLISRGLLGQLGGEPAYATAVARRIAAGDLTSEVATSGDGRSSLLFAMKTMQLSLVQVVSNVRENSESVATASAQIAQGNHDLSARTEQQASAIEQTASSMEELSATVKQNADSAVQANQLALGASAVAIRGGGVVGEVVNTMKDINASSKRIADITNLIDGIAFQTNILALNAAVEAARAGDQGRGFAVVATEVRSLASRSAEAAKEIKKLISASVERVEAGSVLVGQAGVTMTELVNSIKQVTDIMAEISAASTEQSAGVAQVGEAVALMDQATQQNAALVEESAAAAQSLKGQAQKLVQSVAVFHL